MRYLVMENTPLARQVYRLMLMGDTSGIRAPGQFVQVQVPGFYLRRPISVCDWDAQTLTLIVKEVGEGTHAMAAWEIGAQVDLLTGLGNGYTIMQQSQTPLLVGGGVGVPPLYGLARRLVEAGRTPRVALGFQTADDAFYLAEFARLGCHVAVATGDGSLGVRGLVTDLLPTLAGFDYFYACGPERMLHAVSDACDTSGQLSFEERMGCGFGACMGCTCRTKYGDKRICKEGPVLEKEEVIW